MGPWAVSDQWRAQARLGVLCHGTVLWRQGVKLKVALLGRVQEKDSWWTAYVIQKVVGIAAQHGLFSPRDCLCFWSDGGPHYRSTVALTNISNWITAEHKCHTMARFGCEYHMKGEVDAYFALLESRKRKAAASTILNSCEQLVSVLRAEASDNEIIEIIMPDIDKQDFINSHAPHNLRSLPLPIKSTYTYKFSLRSYDRVHNAGRDKVTLTNIKAPTHHDKIHPFCPVAFHCKHCSCFHSIASTITS